MPFDNYPQYLRDILERIENIRDFRGGMTIQEIQSDRKTEAAIERELQIITEAAARLGNQAQVLCPEANWRDVRGFGNVLRHAYDRLDPMVLGTILNEDLPVLGPQVQAALARMTGKP